MTPSPTVHKLITREHPRIETLQVSVNVVRIGPKQMTQAVFRQLHRERLLMPETGALCGVPWGTVNYFWGDCEPNHLHVVWQKGQELRRECLYPHWPLQREKDAIITRMQHNIRLTGHALLMMDALEHPERYHKAKEYSPPQLDPGEHQFIQLPHWNSSTEYEHLKGLVSFLNIMNSPGYSDIHRHNTRQNVSDHLKKLVLSISATLHWPCTPSDLLHYRTEARKQIKSLNATSQKQALIWEEQIEAIKNLPQLFIAV